MTALLISVASIRSTAAIAATLPHTLPDDANVLISQTQKGITVFDTQKKRISFIPYTVKTKKK